MSPTSLRMRRRISSAILPRRDARIERLRVRLSDGAATTVHVARFDRTVFRPRVVRLAEPRPLVRWCREHEVPHAVVGGFYVRPDYVPLGELRIDGVAHPFAPFAEPWGARRACLQIDAGTARIAMRDELDPEPAGDVLQAGPMLVRGGRSIIGDGDDPEGFSAGCAQFDSDITDGRYPRAALGLTRNQLLAVVCDGRTRRDAGMTLGELADTLAGLGAENALNLDGGGSASLVYDGRLRNRPREQHGVDLLDGRTVPTAIVFAAA